MPDVPTVRYWRRIIFWIYYVLLLIPSLFFFALPGAIFIDRYTGAFKAIGILASQELLAFLIPWLLARNSTEIYVERKARNEQRRAGFPVVFNDVSDEKFAKEAPVARAPTNGVPLD